MKIEDEDLENLVSKVKKLEAIKATTLQTLNVNSEQLTSILKHYDSKDKLAKSAQMISK